MSIAFLILAALVCSTPVTLLLDGPILQGIVAAITAGGLVATALRLRPGEAGHLVSVVRPFALVVIAPAVWMLVQLMPLGPIGVSHPIWQSAEAALGHSLYSSITVDIGATLISLNRYLCVVGIALLATAASVDRQRAARILPILIAATTLIAVMLIATSFLRLLDEAPNVIFFEIGTEVSTLGAILAAAGLLRAVERHEARRADRETTTEQFLLKVAACFAAFGACTFAVAMSMDTIAIFALICGLIAIGSVVVIRRLGLGPWGYSAIAATVAVIGLALAVFYRGTGMSDVTLAFATQAPSPLLSVAQRMLNDAPWTGTGAGTFAAMLPVYQDVNELAVGEIGPTTAATVAIELGRPALWGVLLISIVFVVSLLRGALKRGRDSYYPAAGAASITSLAILAFGSTGVFSTTVTIIAASIIGVALAQSKSRPVR